MGNDCWEYFWRQCACPSQVQSLSRPLWFILGTGCFGASMCIASPIWSVPKQRNTEQDSTCPVPFCKYLAISRQIFVCFQISMGGRDGEFLWMEKCKHLQLGGAVRQHYQNHLWQNYELDIHPRKHKKNKLWQWSPTSQRRKEKQGLGRKTAS